LTQTLVIGGGVAGLAAAYELAADREVTLLERESLLATHSSARNAQIWLPVDDDATTGPLACRSAELWTALLGHEGRWLDRSGAVALAPADAAAGLIRGAEKGGLEASVLDRARLSRLAPELQAREQTALEVVGAGVFEPSVMMQALAAACRERGVQVRKRAEVLAIETRSGRIAGATLAGPLDSKPEHIEADEVVIAAGAWANTLAETIGLSTSLVPLRRHLVVLDVTRPSSSIVWSFDPAGEVYWRPESGGVLVSPCDEEESPPCLPTSEAKALELLEARLQGIAPAWVDAPVRTSWACLRTYADDRELLLGRDPRVQGLAWLAGLGGRGMTIGLAAGELLGKAMRGGADVLLDGMRPDRVGGNSVPR